MQTIPSECSNRKSQSYCPDPTFFQRSGQFKTSTGCYYYNSTNAIVEEVNLTSNVVNLLMNKLPSFKRITVRVC